MERKELDMIELQKGDGVCYKAHLCAPPSIHRGSTVEFDPHRVGTFLRYRSMRDAIHAVVRWDGDEKVSFVDPDIIAKRGTAEALDVNHDQGQRAIEWILRTTWEQRQGKIVPDTMVEIEAIGPRLEMIAKRNPSRQTRQNTVRKYIILGKEWQICESCASSLAYRAVCAKARALPDRDGVRRFQHEDCVQGDVVPRGHCERCGRSGSDGKREDGLLCATMTESGNLKQQPERRPMEENQNQITFEGLQFAEKKLADDRKKLVGSLEDQLAESEAKAEAIRSQLEALGWAFAKKPGKKRGRPRKAKCDAKPKEMSDVPKRKLIDVIREELSKSTENGMTAVALAMKASAILDENIPVSKINGVLCRMKKSGLVKSEGTRGEFRYFLAYRAS